MQRLLISERRPPPQHGGQRRAVPGRRKAQRCRRGDEHEMPGVHCSGAEGEGGRGADWSLGSPEGARHSSWLPLLLLLLPVSAQICPETLPGSAWRGPPGSSAMNAPSVIEVLMSSR